MAVIETPVTHSLDDVGISANTAEYPPGGTPTVSTVLTAITPRRSVGFTTSVGLFRFNTAALSGRDILGAAFWFLAGPVVNDDTRSLNGEWYEWTTATVDDWTNTPSATALDVALSTIAGSGIETLPLTNLPETVGVGYVGLRLHISGGEPSGENYVHIASLDSDGSIWAPRLLFEVLPLPPENLAADGSDHESATVTWDAVDGATSYDLRWSLDEADWTDIEDVSSPYLHTGLTPETTYYYQVRASDNEGTSDWSAAVDTTTLAAHAAQTRRRGGRAMLGMLAYTPGWGVLRERQGQ